MSHPAPEGPGFPFAAPSENKTQGSADCFLKSDRVYSWAASGFPEKNKIRRQLGQVIIRSHR